MLQSATPATRNKAMWRLIRKLTTFATIAIGTAIGPSCGRLRTVANGCGRLRKVARRWANTPSTPKPPEWNGNPCYAFWKKTITFSVNMLDYQLIHIAMIKTRTNWLRHPGGSLLRHCSTRKNTQRCISHTPFGNPQAELLPKHFRVASAAKFETLAWAICRSRRRSLAQISKNSFTWRRSQCEQRPWTLLWPVVFLATELLCSQATLYVLFPCQVSTS